MFLYPGENDGELEDCSGGGADGVGVGLEGEGAEVKREAFEWDLGSSFSGSGGACADVGREGIFGGPFRMGDLVCEVVSR